MDSCQPLAEVEDIRVEATWNGDVSSSVNLEIFVDVVAKSKSYLSLIQNDHPSVLFAKVVGILKLSRHGEDASPAVSSRRQLLQQGPFDSPTPISNVHHSRSRQLGNNLLREEGPARFVKDYQDMDRKSVTTRLNDPAQSISHVPKLSSAENAEIPLFAQTASLYEATSDRDSALSPPPPPTSNKLTLPKRHGIEPNLARTPNQQSPKIQNSSQKDDSSLHSTRKRPLSLDKRPPWRPVGAQDTTLRGREQLGTEAAKRRISRSAGPVHVTRGRARQRQSSLPGRIPKAEKDLQKMRMEERHDWPQTLPRGRTRRSPMPTGPRDRETTVKVTRYAEAMTPSERLEKWLEDGRNDSPTDSPTPSELTSDDDIASGLPHLHSSSSPALSPSPTPSSRAGLPWTSVRGIRGGGSATGAHDEIAEEGPIPTLVEDNGTVYALFKGCTTHSRKFCIEIHASVKLEAQPSGCCSLSIPGLPLQSGKAEGTFSLRITEPPFSESNNFKAFEKVAYVEDDFSIHPLQYGQMCHNFRLDTLFSVKLLCFETCRDLEPSDFEIDSDVHTRYDWENLDGDGITAENSMICSIRLRPFLMWADNVRFKLYLIGGPSGFLEASLEPGSRRIHLNGQRCEGEHELEISLVCPVADLQKTFTIFWEQSLGIAPFEVWLPRISGLYRKKLEELFDLPDEAGIAATPRPCKKSRAYSMAAQEQFLKASGEVYFFPENQHTPRTIRQSLTEQSGQFYDELTAEDPISASITPIGPVCKAPLKHSVLTLKPNKRPRTGQSAFLSHTDTEDGFGSTSVIELDKKVDSTVPAQHPLKPVQKSGGAVPPKSKSFLVRFICFILDLPGWLLTPFTRPARLFKIIILTWLCLRAFDPEIVVPLEDSIKSNAISAWDRWTFEPVQLYDDFTGWKHLLAKVNKDTARFIHDGHIGVLGPMDRDSEEADAENEKFEISVIDEDTGPEQTWTAEEPVPVQADFDDDQSSPPSQDKMPPEQRLTLLDRIDRALGWNPPAGGW